MLEREIAIAKAYVVACIKKLGGADYPDWRIDRQVEEENDGTQIC